MAELHAPRGPHEVLLISGASQGLEVGDRWRTFPELCCQPSVQHAPVEATRLAEQ
jgi:hypothetical protein